VALVKLILVGLLIVQVPTLVVQLPGTAGKVAGSATTAETGSDPLLLLVIVKVPVTALPGPVQASGSVTEKLTRLTVIVKLQVAVLLDVSVVVQVTVVVPTTKFEPEGGLHTVVAIAQLSLVVGAL
jgi:hypothetical protein